MISSNKVSLLPQKVLHVRNTWNVSDFVKYVIFFSMYTLQNALGHMLSSRVTPKRLLISKPVGRAISSVVELL